MPTESIEPIAAPFAMPQPARPQVIVDTFAVAAEGAEDLAHLEQRVEVRRVGLEHGAKRPQCVLLAVPPSVGLENWTFDTLLATVNEAFDLAKLRAVRPQDLVDGLGLMLPANYLPENPTPDVPSVRLNELLKYGAAKYSGVVALGKA